MQRFPFIIRQFLLGSIFPLFHLLIKLMSNNFILCRLIPFADFLCGVKFIFTVGVKYFNFSATARKTLRDELLVNGVLNHRNMCIVMEFTCKQRFVIVLHWHYYSHLLLSLWTNQKVDDTSNIKKATPHLGKFRTFIGAVPCIIARLAGNLYPIWLLCDLSVLSGYFHKHSSALFYQVFI